MGDSGWSIGDGWGADDNAANAGDIAASAVWRFCLEPTGIGIGNGKRPYPPHPHPRYDSDDCAGSGGGEYGRYPVNMAQNYKVTKGQSSKVLPLYNNRSK